MSALWPCFHARSATRVWDHSRLPHMLSPAPTQFHRQVEKLRRAGVAAAGAKHVAYPERAADHAARLYAKTRGASVALRSIDSESAPVPLWVSLWKKVWLHRSPAYSSALFHRALDCRAG